MPHLVADEVSRNERLMGLYDTFQMFDTDRQRVSIETGTDMLHRDFSQLESKVLDDRGKAFPQMVPVECMKHYAKSIKCPCGAGRLVEDLRGVIQSVTRHFGW